MEHPLPWLKYIDADDLDDSRVDFDGLNVESPVGEHLGDVDGFIVDNDNGRPYYVVVDAGGWFKSKSYLLPVGQVRLDGDRDALIADLSRDRIERFPGFDKDEFDRLDEDGIRRFNNETSSALTGMTQSYPDAEHFSTAWSRPEFRYPDWWQAEPVSRSRAADDGLRSAASYGDMTPTMADLTRPVDRGAEIRAAESAAAATRGVEADARRDDRTGVRDSDPSPHFDGRAQPGDVLGVETGGETTQIGDTAEDENARRRSAESDAPKRRD